MTENTAVTLLNAARRDLERARDASNALVRQDFVVSATRRLERFHAELREDITFGRAVGC